MRMIISLFGWFDLDGLISLREAFFMYQGVIATPWGEPFVDEHEGVAIRVEKKQDNYDIFIVSLVITLEDSWVIIKSFRKI